MNDITRAILDAGLLQFGRFTVNSTVAYYRERLAYLPSYPYILKLLVDAALPHMAKLNANRLVSTADALPFALALSLETEVPLVYSANRGKSPTFDLIGAYDIGHPTLLVVNVLSAADEDLAPFIAGARRVGLDVKNTLALLDVSSGIEQPALLVKSLLRLSEVVQQLESERQIPHALAQAVLSSLQ